MQEQFRNLDFYFSEISIFTSGYRDLKHKYRKFHPDT